MDNPNTNNDKTNQYDPNTSGMFDSNILEKEETIRRDNVRVPINRMIFEFLDLFALCFVFLVLLFTFFVRLVTVDGDSMNYTLIDKDRLVISRLFYTPANGDIVVIQVPNAEKQPPLIKRVIATEGQTININFDTWEVTVDGKVLDEPYINKVNATMLNLGAYTYPHKVSEGKIFVMGDNRNASKDSRSPDINEIDNRNIIGKVYFRLFPISNFGDVDKAYKVN